MADQPLRDLTEETDPGGDDLVYVVTDPDGTPADRKVKLSNLPGSGANGALLAAHQWHPDPSVDVMTTSATAADVDAANAAITFTLDEQADVLIEASGVIQHAHSTTRSMFWGLRENTTDLVESKIAGNGSQAGSGLTRDVYVAARWVVKDVSAGAHTFKLSHRITAGTGFTRAGVGEGPLVLTAKNLGPGSA